MASQTNLVRTLKLGKVMRLSKQRWPPIRLRPMAQHIGYDTAMMEDDLKFIANRCLSQIGLKEGKRVANTSFDLQTKTFVSA